MREYNLVQHTTPSLPKGLLFLHQLPLHHHFYEHFPKYYFLCFFFFIVFL